VLVVDDAVVAVERWRLIHPTARWSQSGSRSDGVKWEAADANWAGNEDVADEHETEREASGVSSFGEIVEVKFRHFR